MSNAVKTIDHVPTTTSRNTITPLEMLDRALSSNADPDTLAKLMALQERWQANQARMAFDEAISNAKAEIKPVIRNAKGHNDKRYADFAAIASAVDPIITKFGLSYRFKTAQTDRISVTCVLSHKEGHFEETTLAGPPDTSGSKNAIQAIGSTLTYLQRYSLTQALGLAATNDDDGKAAGLGETISEEQVIYLRELIEAVGADERKFLAHGKVERLADIRADQFEQAVRLLKSKGERK
jgi:hypothetical protein